MNVQQMKSDLPISETIVSGSLGGEIVYKGGLFFLNDEQIELSNQQIKDLHSDVMLNDLQGLSEHNPDYYYESR